MNVSKWRKKAITGEIYLKDYEARKLDFRRRSLHVHYITPAQSLVSHGKSRNNSFYLQRHRRLTSDGVVVDMDSTFKKLPETLLPTSIG